MKILFVKNSEIYSGGFYARAALRRTRRTSSGGLSSGKINARISHIFG